MIVNPELSPRLRRADHGRDVRTGPPIGEYEGRAFEHEA